MIVWGICGVLIGRYLERLKWNDLIKSGKFPNPVERPLEWEVLAAAKAYVKEIEHPVQDGSHKKDMQNWLIEAVINYKLKRFKGDMV